MAQLFVPLTGPFRTAAGSGFNTFGESLERPQWQGCEIGSLATFPDVWAATSEAEFHDWIIGVHHPLFLDGGPRWCRFLDRDPAVRQQMIEVAVRSAQSAHHVGARYILFHFPWPALLMDGRNHLDEGWYFFEPDRQERESDWSEAEVYEASRGVFERLAEVQETEKIKVVLEIDGPNRFFFDGEMYQRLFTEFPELSLCIDTGRLGLLARTHGRDPAGLCRPWLPWARHLHLHTSLWDEQGRYHNHRPTNDTHRAALWPRVTPAADIAEIVASAHPRCTIVLEHDPRTVTAEELEAAHKWVAGLAARRPDR